MRTSVVVTALAMMVVALTVGCSRDVTGTAQPDPRAPGTAVTDDGFGIIVGDPQAPVQIELFTEPQCSHCADLQVDFGQQLGSYIDLGLLAVTYRPMIFYDTAANDHSARVSNALFLAAGPDTSGPAFQTFVEDLWAQHDMGGSDLTDADIADMAKKNAIGAAEVDKIAAGDAALDVQDMADTNFAFLYDIDPVDTGTPTVYDLGNNDKVDIYDDNWLSKLMSAA
jgi:protein-disulfide isomerase